MKLLIASIAALAIASPAVAQTTPTSNTTMTSESHSTTMKSHKTMRHHTPVKHRKHRVRHTHTTKVKAHVTTSSTTGR